ncbi:alpha/beta hydrolase family protein [Virgibacillus litoralis]|uniref:Dienelactone hydrolase n=1 Tax=Virgibacillus litoralis TaxID=578221 RepID=A0ABS4HCK0_9BACI|nr:dienelactone hydrolase family protein [Virgibacillus litoralis]MBP1948439.1 dienelactone hydrolase [Virgibacillus litoralis]
MTYKLHMLNEQGIPSLIEGIDSTEDWLKQRSDIFKRWQDMLGKLPERVPLDLKVHAELKEESFIRQHITYNTADDDTVTAYLLIPEGAVEKKLPAVIALHGTDEMGKDSISTNNAKHFKNYATELAKRGYVVLVPDALTAGERIKTGEKPFYNAYFYRDFPQYSSITAKNLVDHRQGIDLLESHQVVDTNRIGAIGHSFGGYNAYYLAGIDDRVKAVVTSCGFSMFTGDYRPQRWADRDWYTHFPKLTPMIAEGDIPFEFHEILALVAPKPVFNWSGQSDSIFPHWKSIASGLHNVYQLYEKLGYHDHFTSLFGAEGHEFPPHIRESAYQFLDKWLDNEMSS